MNINAINIKTLYLFFGHNCIVTNVTKEILEKSSYKGGIRI